MKYSVQQIEQALRDGKIISFGYKNLYQAKISEGQVVVFWGMNDKVGYSLPDFLNNFHNDGWICTKIEGEEIMEKNTPHKHAELIKKWAEGAVIQVKLSNGTWFDVQGNPSWSVICEYRVKPTLVKKWKWVIKTENKFMYVTNGLYSSPDDYFSRVRDATINNVEVLQKIDSTMIEVEEQIC